MFKEIQERIERKKRAAQIETQRERQLTLQDSKRALKDAKADQDEVEKQYVQKLEIARELLRSTNAHSLLESVKKEVWNTGKVVFLPGYFSASEMKYWDGTASAPIFEPKSNIVFPSVELIAKKTVKQRFEIHKAITIRGSPAGSTMMRRGKDKEHVTSSLKISTTSSPNELLILRKNSTSLVLTDDHLHGEYQLNYENLIKDLNKKSGYEIYPIYEPEKLHLKPSRSIIHKSPFNPLYADMLNHEEGRHYQKRLKEYNELPQPIIAVGVRTSSLDFNEPLTDVLKHIVTQDTFFDRLPGDFLREAKNSMCEVNRIRVESHSNVSNFRF